MLNAKKKETKETVLVGLTGGIDSTVAAYLLKKQGYNVIGTCLVMMSKEAIETKDDENILNDIRKKEKSNKGTNNKKSLNDEEDVIYEVTPTCNIEQLNKVQDICEKLEIPFYGIDAKDLYKDKVIDFLVSARLSGIEFNPCVACNQVKLEILMEKAKTMKAKFVATGHYAKIFTNVKTGECSLLAANDLDYDQSFFLSRLTPLQLRSLLLPFGDIRRKDVERIAESLGFEFKKKDYIKKICFNKDSRLPYFVKKRSSPDLREGGNIVSYEDGNTLGEHQGVYQYYVGQREVPVLDDNPLPESQMVISVEPIQKIIMTSQMKNFKWNHTSLVNVQFIEELDKTKPFTAFVQTSFDAKKSVCKIWIKNNNACVVELESAKEELLVKGQLFVFYNKEGVGGKIIGSGEVQQFYHYVKGEFLKFPKRDIDINPDNPDENIENRIYIDKLGF